MPKAIDPGVLFVCWSCTAAHPEPALFCSQCGKIQPPPGMDFFSVFALPPHLNLHLSSLETEFHRLSRRLHPDRFARAAENEKEWSLAGTALLNDAWRTLKDPIARTEYLLKLHGEIGEPDKQHRARETRVPADLLEEVFDLNMQLEEMRIAHKSGEENPALTTSLAEIAHRFESLRDAVDRDLRAQWNAWDNGNAEQRQAAQKALLALLDRRRYLSNLVRDVTETLEGQNSTLFSERGR